MARIGTSRPSTPPLGLIGQDDSIPVPGCGQGSPTHPLAHDSNTRPATLFKATADHFDYSNSAKLSRRTELGTENSGRNDQPIIQLWMGQCLVADLRKIKICSKGFFSCSAIIVYNDETKRGGVCHVPARWDKQPDIVKQSVYAMMQECEPTKVYLDKRPLESWASVGYKMDRLASSEGDDDWRKIQKFINEDCQFKGHFAETPKSVSGGDPGQYLAYVTYVNGNGELAIETRWAEYTAVDIGNDQTPEGELAIAKKMAAMPTCVKFGMDLH